LKPILKQEILDEITNLDYHKIQKSIETFMIEQISVNNANGIIFGLSGGIDSAVIAYLCANVNKQKSLALLMPDSKVSPTAETSDAIKIIESLGIESKLIDINPIQTEYSKYLEPNKLALGNLSARIRANILYYYANIKNYLVVGSSDKSEYMVGYFTKFGDGSADIIPIVTLYKTQVRKLAKVLGVPDTIIQKKSSPNLWPGHMAEEEIGASYEEIDSILYCIFDKKMSLEDTANATGIEKYTIDKIFQLHKKSQHKRATPTAMKNVG